MSMNKRKTSRSYFRRIASNAFEKSISSISIPYLYRWHFAASHRRPHSSSTVDRPRRKPLCGGERKSFTLSEIRCEVRRDNVFLRVVSSSIGIRLFRGPSDMPGFCSAISTTVLTVSCFDIITTYIIILQLRSIFILIYTLIITANLTRSLKEGLVTLVFLCGTVSSFKKRYQNGNIKHVFTLHVIV